VLHDSFADFLGAAGKILNIFKHPYFRPLKLGSDNRQDMDDSVNARFAGDPSYRPKNQGFPLP
jgi:hypothetical protein